MIAKEWLHALCFVSVWSLSLSLGYYTTSTYYKINADCNNIDEFSNSDLIVQTGYSYGECIVGYDSTGDAINSQIYSSTCSISASNTYTATITTYDSTDCSGFVSSTSTESFEAGCSNNGNYTNIYSCYTSLSEPPYSQLPAGFVSGLSSDPSQCSSELAVEYTWTVLNKCVQLNDQSIKYSCSSDTASTTTAYSDEYCKNTIDIVTQIIDTCSADLNAVDDDVLSYTLYPFGICQDPDISNDDNVDLSLGGVIGISIASFIVGTCCTGLIFILVLAYCWCCPEIFIKRYEDNSNSLNRNLMA